MIATSPLGGSEWMHSAADSTPRTRSASTVVLNRLPELGMLQHLTDQNPSQKIAPTVS
jgi:hypothetical protein